MGERAHLFSPQINLQTHITDVINLIECEQLNDVVLVGHSYGGMVITGVADQLLQKGANCLRHLVYLDAVTPHPGESWSSCHTPETVAKRVQAAQAAGGRIPFPDASMFGLEGADRDWVNARMTVQPLTVYQNPLQFEAQRLAALPRTFIDCTNPALPTISIMRQRVRHEPGWCVLELACGHDPMVNMPGPLSKLLLDCAKA